MALQMCSCCLALVTTDVFILSPDVDSHGTTDVFIMSPDVDSRGTTNVFILLPDADSHGTTDVQSQGRPCSQATA